MYALCVIEAALKFSGNNIELQRCSRDFASDRFLGCSKISNCVNDGRLSMSNDFIHGLRASTERCRNLSSIHAIPTIDLFVP